MLTAEQRALNYRKVMGQIGQHPVVDPVLTTGKSLLTTLFEECEKDAFAAGKAEGRIEGMTEALLLKPAKPTVNFYSDKNSFWFKAGVNHKNKAIEAARDGKKE